MDTIEQLYIEKEELRKEAQEHSFTAEMFWRAVCEVEKVIIEKEQELEELERIYLEQKKEKL